MHVYILKCSDGTYYTGVTNNVQRRLQEHQTRLHPDAYTASRLPVELVYTTSFTKPFDAIKAEKQLKGWSRRKKEALIQGDLDLLVEYSKRQTRSTDKD